MNEYMQWNITQPYKGNPAICDTLKGTVLSEISQTENDKYHTISLLCGIYIYTSFPSVYKHFAISPI